MTGKHNSFTNICIVPQSVDLAHDSVSFTADARTSLKHRLDIFAQIQQVSNNSGYVLFLLRAMPSNPSNPEPNSHAVAGMGTAETVPSRCRAYCTPVYPASTPMAE